MKNPSIFISYSHDSPEHMDRVLEFSGRLRAEGIDCHIDQYEESPPEGWPRWMVNQIEAADFVLVVCTEIYERRFRGKEETGKGLGAKWEGAILTQELYEAEANNTKFIPIVFSHEDSNYIPIVLRGATYYDLSTEEDYEDLYRRLTNQPRIKKPKLGEIRSMPSRERKQDFFVPSEKESRPTKQELLERIKSRGYWHINFRPLVDAQKLGSLGICKDIVERNSVGLRGWDYPHVPRRTGYDTDLEPGDDFYQGWIDSGRHKEFWRMYQSGQFLHYLALKEDWLKYPYIGSNKVELMSSLAVVNTIYQITEVFEFLSRLARDGIYDEGVKVSISLNNTEGRELLIEEWNRASFRSPKKTAAPKIEFVGEYTKEQAVNESQDLAIEAMRYIFDRFGWHDPSEEVLRGDQEKLLTSRI